MMTRVLFFQERVVEFMLACFGRKVAADTAERNHRFLEEALELVQALGCTASEAHQLVDYVYARPIGNSHQEVGGVMVTLAALCASASLDMQEAGEDELRRVWTVIEKIRAKQAAKPRFSPLPAASSSVPREAIPSYQVDAMCDELAKICAATGRSKDGTGRDVDWFELSGDVVDLVRQRDELVALLEAAIDRKPMRADTYHAIKGKLRELRA